LRNAEGIQLGIQNLLIVRRDMYTVVWAVKKNVHIDNRENESKIYGEDDYGKPKN
jgi:hypothetical protein